MTRALLPLIVLVVLTAPALATPVTTLWLPPPPEFPDVTDGSGFRATFPAVAHGEGGLLDVLPAGSPVAADFNGDGFNDVLVPAPARGSADAAPATRLFLNDASTVARERFVDVTDVAGLDVRGHAFAATFEDVNGDDRPDVFVGGHRMAFLYLNNGDGTFRNVTAAAGLPQDGFVLGAAWGDFDGDGVSDLVLAEFVEHAPGDAARDPAAFPGRANRLLVQGADGAFTDATATAGFTALARRSTSVAVVDADRDGTLDVFFTSYGGGPELWLGNGDGSFRERADAVGLADARAGTCQAWEDYDNDGLLDLFVAHASGGPGALWLARADGATGVAFEDASARLPPATGTAWGCAPLDHDMDGDMDLFIGRGDPFAEDGRLVSTLLANGLRDAGRLAFADVTAEAGDRDVRGYEDRPTIADAAMTSGVLAADWQLDGTPDVVTSTNDGAGARLFKNAGWMDGWAGGAGETFKVWLSSATGTAGATVTVTAGNITITRQVGAAASWGGRSMTELGFGLAKPDEGGYRGEDQPVSVTIRWPSGRVEAYPRAFGPDSAIRFTEGVGAVDDAVAPRAVLRLVAGERAASGWFTSEDVAFQVSAVDEGTGGSRRSGVRALAHDVDGAGWVAVPEPSRGGRVDVHGDGVHVLRVRVEDHAGNRAVTPYPVRVDTTPPTGTVLVPRAGGAYALGQEHAHADAPVDRALVVAGDAPVNVTARAEDALSGVASVTYRVVRTDGRVPDDQQATVRDAPYAWAWPAHALAAGEYRFETTLEDRAGNAATLTHRVIVVPTTVDGFQATTRDRPSTPTFP